MKKLVVLFPEAEFLHYSYPVINEYIDCIIKRYTHNGYCVNVVNFKNSSGFYNLLNKKNIDSGIDPRFEKLSNEKIAEIITKLNVEEKDKFVVCGFNCFDNVYKFANELYKRNKNVIIDSDLTEKFPVIINQKNYIEKEFNPNNQIIDYIYTPYAKPSNETRQKLFELYSNPVWGISKKYLKKLKPNDNEI